MPLARARRPLARRPRPMSGPARSRRCLDPRLAPPRRGRLQQRLLLVCPGIETRPRPRHGSHDRMDGDRERPVGRLKNLPPRGTRHLAQAPPSIPAASQRQRNARLAGHHPGGQCQRRQALQTPHGHRVIRTPAHFPTPVPATRARRFFVRKPAGRFFPLPNTPHRPCTRNFSPSNHLRITLELAVRLPWTR